MQPNQKTLARQVTVRDLERTRVIEVNGELDLIGGYDLRQALTAALRSANGAVTLDLSSVTAVDDEGAASLEWCSAEAIRARRVLMWTPCSQPLVRDLRDRVATSPRGRHTRGLPRADGDPSPLLGLDVAHALRELPAVTGEVLEGA